MCFNVWVVFVAIIFYTFTYLFIFGCTGASLLCSGFLYLWGVRAALLLWSMGSRPVGLSSCGTWAYLPLGIWNPPRPGIEPMSPALSGRFPTTVPQGKVCCHYLKEQKGMLRPWSLLDCGMLRKVPTLDSTDSLPGMVEAVEFLWLPSTLHESGHIGITCKVSVIDLSSNSSFWNVWSCSLILLRSLEMFFWHISSLITLPVQPTPCSCGLAAYSHRLNGLWLSRSSDLTK